MATKAQKRLMKEFNRKARQALRGTRAIDRRDLSLKEVHEAVVSQMIPNR